MAWPGGAGRVYKKTCRTLSFSFPRPPGPRLGNLSWGGGTERVFDLIVAFETFTSTIAGAKIGQPFLGWRCRTLFRSDRSPRKHSGPRLLGPRLNNLSWDGGAERKIPGCKAQRQQRATRGCNAHSRATSDAGVQTTQVAKNDAGMQTALAAKSDAGAKSTLAARARRECKTRGQQRMRQGCAAHGQQRVTRARKAHRQQRATRGGGPKASRAQRRLARGARRETLLHERIFPLGLLCCSAAGSSACGGVLGTACWRAGGGRGLRPGRLLRGALFRITSQVGRIAWISGHVLGHPLCVPMARIPSQVGRFA
jgi:hypothetical protein